MIDEETIKYLGYRMLRDVKEYITSQWMRERLGHNYQDALVIVQSAIKQMGDSYDR